MERPSYLSKHVFDWELFDVVVSGKSTLDTKFFIGPLSADGQVQEFLKGYGFDPSNLVNRAELFGIFQEAIQFVRRYFLREGNPDGPDLQIPASILGITEVSDLFLFATGNIKNQTLEDRLWSEIVIKVMHTILHIDKDLRSNYFSVIQTQIFDRFYKYIHRDENNKLYLGHKDSQDRIPLVDFETKSKKARESMIIKLLHKVENVAEEVFDRVGVRFITETPYDILRVIRFLVRNNVVIPHNIKPSRSLNTIIDIKRYKETYWKITKRAIRENLSEEEFLKLAHEASQAYRPDAGSVQMRNEYSSKFYSSIQFTGRHLINHKNSFLPEFNDVKKFARTLGPDNELAKKVLALDTSLIAKDIRFFYPFEVQLMDVESLKKNTDGEASHMEYKRAQTKAAMKRVFWALLKNKNIEID